MKKYLFLFAFSFVNFSIFGQQYFNFSCQKDTALACGTTCFSLNAYIPNLKLGTNDYSIETKSACYKNPIPVETPGNPTSLTTDDRYTSVINLPFDFNFFGITYNSLVISTNGVVSFDITEAGGSAHYGIYPNSTNGLTSSGTTPQDLPSDRYDRAIIMGPYHDIDPSEDLASPNLRVDYDVTGIAPYRKWVLSFYKIPLFSTNCTDLIENTHQIVLFESTNIIEVFINDKEICNGWNGGRAMVGIQNFDKDKAYMVEGRKASDPPWGSIGMNERYRFTPTGGVTLFRKVELFDLNNNLIATGDTTSFSSTTLKANFTNVCFSPGLTAEKFIVKSTYANALDLSDIIIGIDTIFPYIGTNLIPTYIINPAVCNTANGSFTVNIASPPSPIIGYSLNGGPQQGSNFFNNLAANTYNVTVYFTGGCFQIFSVIIPTQTGINVNATPTLTSCLGVNNGSVILAATSGTSPFQYSIANINSGTFQNLANFTGLASGSYNFTIKDANGCIGNGSFFIIQGANLQSSFVKVDPTCSGFSNGSITITPTTGTAPYQYSLNGGAFQNSNSFTTLGSGNFTYNFRDNIGCTGSGVVNLIISTPIVLNLTPTNPKCYQNSDGIIIATASGGTLPYQYSLNGGAFQSSNQFNNLVTGGYVIIVKDALGCTKTGNVTLTEPDELIAFAFSDSATCFGNDGQIFVAAIGGTTDYEYSIDNGVNYQVLPLFQNVNIGIYNNIKVKDAQGCIADSEVEVFLLDTMRLELGADTSVCLGSSYTMKPQTNTATSIFTYTSINLSTINNPTVANAVVTPTDTTKYYLLAQWGVCSRNDSITVKILMKPQANAGADTIICHKANPYLHGSIDKSSGGVKYTWLPSSKVVNSASQNTTGLADSTFTYTLEVTDNYGCNFKTSDNILVTMRPPVPAFAGNDSIAATNIPHLLQGAGGSSYKWTPGFYLNNDTLAKPLATLPSSQTFYLVVKNDIGCLGFDTVFLKVYDGPTYKVPNAFTPNGDGLNDLFKVIPVEIKTRLYFRVYNRFGELVYQTTEWLKGWDGKLNGLPQPNGNYVWVVKGIDKFGKIQEFKGSVLLMR